MNLAKIQVSGVRAVAVDAVREIPAGIVGATVQLEYTDSIWAGLNKAVIFRGNTTKEVLTNETTVTVPAEVVAEPRGRLRVGIYGTDAANNVIMPTLWAELGVIADSAEPSVPTNSSLPIWAQLWAMIGNLSNLDTEAKSSLVAAINELAAKSGGSADPEEVKKIVEEYLAENPPKETDPTVSDWAKQPEKPTYTADEVGALAQGDLQTGIDQALAQAKENGEFNGPKGDDYVLTESDKSEIAEQAAGLVEIPKVDLTGVVKSVNGQAPDQNGNVEIEVSGGNAALTADQLTALDGMFRVCAFIKADISAEYNAFKSAFGITDSGGGEVEPEEPDVPVIPDEPETGVSNETTWTDGVPYTVTLIEGYYIGSSTQGADAGQPKASATSAYNDYLYCYGAASVKVTGSTKASSNYNAWYDADKNFISSFSVSTGTTTHTVPEGAYYFRMSSSIASMQARTITPYASA